MTLPSIDQVTAFFPYHRRCLVKVLLLFTHAVIQSRTCSLYKCAERLPGRFQSQYQRLLRFTRMKRSEQFAVCVSVLILSLLPPGAPVYLVIDRSNWRLGKQPINLLYIGLVVNQRCFVPVLFDVLEKHGSSNQGERIALLERFATLWPSRTAERGLILLGDREFVGKTWVKWLHTNGFGLVIRIRENDYFHEVAESLGVAWSHMRRYLMLAVRAHGSCVVEIALNGCVLYYVAVPDEKKPGQYTSFLSHEGNAIVLQAHYRRRWSIEVFFKHVKTNGFNLEDLNLVEISRIRVVLAAVGLAYVLALQAGLEFEADAESVVVMKRNRRTGQLWRARSIFRVGYTWLVQQVRTMAEFVRHVVTLIEGRERERSKQLTDAYVRAILQSVQ